MTGELWAVDPGLRCTGWAHFMGGHLFGCGGIRTDPDWPVAEAIHHIAERLRKMPLVVVEKPQVYVRRRSKGDPNDLIDLAVLAGAICAKAGRAVQVHPRDWKGTIPKARLLSQYMVHRRNERDLGEAGCAAYRIGLSTLPNSLRHNIADAVGIGLWAIRNPKRLDTESRIEDNPPMRKMTQDELAPLAEELRRRPMTLNDVKAACGVSRETAYRYLRTIHVAPPETLGQFRTPEGDKAWQIVKPS